MTDETDRLLGSIEDSRRSFLKKSALASGALAVGASGTTVAQQDGDVLDENWKALIFISSFNPNAKFAFVSGVVDWTPNYGDVRDSFFSDYNTYHIRWLNNDNIVPLFVAQDANIGEYDSDLGFVTDPDGDQNQPQLFEMNREWTPFGDNERLITVNVSPVDEEDEDTILETDDWWIGTGDDGGQTGTETETPTGTPTDEGPV